MRSFLIKIIVSLVLMLTMVILGGCTINHSYTPSAYPISPKLITSQFKSESTASVINIAPDSRVIMLLLYMGRTTHIYYGSLREMTDTAVSLLSRELKKRGMTVRDVGNDVPKVLKLSVTDISVSPISAPRYLKILLAPMAPIPGGTTIDYIGYRATVFLSVEIGNGDKREYFATNDSGFSVKRACDGSISRVLADVLSDSSVIDYLK